MHILRKAILVISLAGGSAFLIAFVVSYTNPVFVEGVAQEMIRDRISHKAQEKIEALDTGYLARSAERMSERYSAEISRVKQQLATGLPALLAETILQMRDIDCECRRKIESKIREGLQWQIVTLSQAREGLLEFIRAKYMEIAERLTLEFRIFTATNALVLFALAFAAGAKPRAGLLLLPASLVLSASAIATGYFYIFQQDWLRTIIFGTYVGFAYIGYLGIVFALLADLVFNRGRVTATLLNLFLQLIGSAASVLPC